jgi:tetraacyldisaccharide 4'-kinase
MFKTPQFWLYKKSLISLILLPLSFLYKIGFLLKKTFVKTQKVELPIICIGNIIAGGAGKTPVALALGEFFKENNIEFCYLTRGYKSKNNKALIIENSNQFNVEEVGDEALLLAEIAPTCVAKNRYLGYKKIRENKKYKAIIMDDGLQNFQLKYTIKILVIDSKIAFGNNRLLPSGPMRQSLTEVVKNIDLFVIIGQKNLQIERQILQHNQNAKILFAKILASNLDKFINKDIVAFCGLAYPQKFFDFIKNNSLNLVETNVFADHYQYKNEDLEKLYQNALSKNLKLITTKKDWVKFPQNFQEKIDYLDIKLDFENKIFFKNLLNKINVFKF